MAKQNLTLLTDLYQLTMMQGYFKANNKNVAVFDAFYRKNLKKTNLNRRQKNERNKCTGYHYCC